MFAEIRLQSTLRWKILVKFLYMSSHVSFLYEFSNCGTCCLFKDENAAAVFFLKKVFGSCIIFIYFIFSLHHLKRKAEK